MAIKVEVGGGKALMAWPLVEDFFFAASLSKEKQQLFRFSTPHEKN